MPQEQSIKDFCAAICLGAASYYHWLKKYRQSAGPSKQSFAPVQIASPSSFVVTSIQLPGGAVTSVYDLYALSFMQSYL
jgi:hypothetical protein